MKLIKNILIVVLFTTLTATALAQYEYPGAAPEKEEKQRKPRPEWRERVFFRPNLGFSLWEDMLYLEIAPLVGYKLTPRLWLGAGPEYMFLKYGPYQTSIYGAKAFTSFAVLDNINEVTNLGIGSVFVHLEQEMLNIELAGQGRDWYYMALGGVGIRMPIGNRMGISIVALWGLNEATELLYSNPEIRILYDF